MFALLTSGLFYGQANLLGATISWDKEVGCQVYKEDPNQTDGKQILLEDISNSECIKVCENSIVNYEIGVMSNSAVTTLWNVLGGDVLNQTATSCTIEWGNQGFGNIDIVISNANGSISKSLCIEKIILPTASFACLPNSPYEPIAFGCVDQTIFFTNFSSTNNGTALVSYIWDFGDNHFSSQESPSHAYAENGTYEVTLTVKNNCNCTATFTKIVKIKSKGFDALCPTVICENSARTYSLPQDAVVGCIGRYNWSILGGSIQNVNQTNGNVDVLWNNVGPTGFGILTFNPISCGVDCIIPSSIRIPVIKSKGTITGNSNICIGEQAIYKLPLWPGTTFNWEIIGNVNNNLGALIVGAQNNEIIFQSIVGGDIILRATYYNTLLRCGGTAIFNINVTNPGTIIGPTTLCENTVGNYSTTPNMVRTWTLKNINGATIYTATNSAAFSYNFITPSTYYLSIGSSLFCPAQQVSIQVLSRPIAPDPNTIKVALPNGNLDFASNTKVCPNTPYTYSAPSTASTNFIYQWSVTNGSINGSTAGETVSITFTGTGQPVLTLVKVSIFGNCISPAVSVNIPLQQIEAVIGRPVPNQIVNTELSLCGNQYREYQLNRIGLNALYTEGETYTWSVEPAYLGSIVLGQNTNRVNVLWNNVTGSTPNNTAVLKCIINKCTISLALTNDIIVTQVPEIAIIASAQNICSGSDISFTVQGLNGFQLPPSTVVTWNDGTGDFTGSLIRTISFNNIGTINNVTKNITARIATLTGCNATTNTAQVSVNVLPGPAASASLSTQFNAFCDPNDIAATLSVASSMNGVSIQWYKDYVVMPGQTGATLQVTNSPATGFGVYYFVATNITTPSCSTKSNNQSIIEFCTQPDNCAITPTPSVSNNSDQTCNVLNLIGTASSGFVNQYFNISGPSTNELFYSQPTLVVTKAGEYHIFNIAEYPIPNSNETCKYKKYKKVLVPYVPNFTYKVTCSNNNNFNVELVDNSDFFVTGISNQTVKYFYKLNNATTYSGPISGTQINNLPAGNYKIKIEIQANYLGQIQNSCNKEISVNLQSIPDQVIIINPQPTNCHDSAVEFSLSIFQDPANSFIWTFEPNAQSTLVETKRVFSTSGLQVVTVDVTNKFGCSRRFSTTLNPGALTTVMIPERCFNGTVTAVPANAKVCKGNSVTLAYTPQQDNCNVDSYVWMNGLTPVFALGVANPATIQVTDIGSYWVKVKNTTTCQYDTPNRIVPEFLPLPQLSLSADSLICGGSTITATIGTTASNINWLLDNNPLPSFNNQTTVNINGVLVGNHVLTVIVTENSCSASGSHQVTIAPIPTQPVITQEIFCEGQNPSIPQYHVILTATVDAGATVLWSNGMMGTTITVYEGGPYQAKATATGCSVTSQVDVPYNPDRYMWSVPTGCLNDCFDRANTATLLAPLQYMNAWGWLENGNTISSGTNSFPQPLVINSSGSYSLYLNNGACEATSKTLNYNITECRKCPIKDIIVSDVLPNNERFCSFNVLINIMSIATFQATITSNNPNIIFVPAGHLISNGNLNYGFTILPINNFAGGTIICTITGALPNGELCTENFELVVPPCRRVVNKTDNQLDNNFEAEKVSKIEILPNPATESAAITYVNLALDTAIELYDLQGRLLNKYNNTTTDGEWIINTTSLPAGMYVVVALEHNNIVAQQKLVIKK